MSYSIYAASFRYFLKKHGEVSPYERKKVKDAIKIALDLVCALTTLRTKFFDVSRDSSGTWTFKGEVSRGDGATAIATITNKNSDDLVEQVAEWATSFVID
jgi:hypothetical protein